ncbi:MAG: hypothetical protein LBU11_08060 [Zoogloeaceae bacterium]|nr:hypothetical protein [Zoogloeaceae bacterium]
MRANGTDAQKQDDEGRQPTIRADAEMVEVLSISAAIMKPVKTGGQPRRSRDIE